MQSVSSLAVEFAAPYQIRILRSRLKKPGPGEALVRTICSGISAGTELLAYRGQLPAEIDLDSSISGMQAPIQYPFKYGYSAVGEIAAVSSSEYSHLVGKRVFAFQPHESYFLSSIERLIILPDAMTPEDAVFLSNMETAVSLLMDGAPIIGENVLILGLGVVGILLAQLLQRYPLGKITLVDPIKKRRALVNKTIHTEILSSIEKQRSGHVNYDLVYEVSGHPDALRQALLHAGYKARVIVGSWYGTKNVNLDLGSHFHRSKITIYPSQVSKIDPSHSGRWSKSRRLKVAISMLEIVRPNYLISHQYNIRNARSAYEKLSTDSDMVQVLLTYN